MPASKVIITIATKENAQYHRDCEAVIVSRAEFGQFVPADSGTADVWKEAVWPTFGKLHFPYMLSVDLQGEDHLQAARVAAVKAGRLLQDAGLTSLAIPLPEGSSVQTLGLLRAWVEGVTLGAFKIRSYRLGEEKNSNSSLRITFVVDDKALIEEALKTAELASIYAESTNYARDLTNVPSNLLTPDRLAREAAELAGQFGLTCLVLDETDIAAQGMGGLSSVGQGSSNPPRMITLRYEGNPSSSEVLGLVGKGITFDTGGISLKKADGMEEMISDMGGAAVVLAVMQAISRMKLSINVTAVIAAAENMPSGSAYRPGDVITTLSGRTVEVLNTDAEGRIVLADAMTYAISQGATRLIDVATLTGAVLIALGDIATAAVTNNDMFLSGLLTASKRSGEKLWQLPAYPEYRELLKSEIADLKNSAGKWAGVITGAMFIGEFAEGLPWIHLDTGGTAWLWKESSIDPIGGTGSMVRTLLYFIAEQE